MRLPQFASKFRALASPIVVTAELATRGHSEMLQLTCLLTKVL
jgi:hypothetical protein